MKERKHKICEFNDIYCKQCDNETFKIEVMNGGGGSGTYLKFTCLKCGQCQEWDFDNPDYDG